MEINAVIYLMHNTTAAGLLNSIPLMPQPAICHNTQSLTFTSHYRNLFS